MSNIRWKGIVLIITFWSLNWTMQGLRTHWGFFPLWLGYCLFVSSLVSSRNKSSLLTRNYSAYFGLFLISIPVWWLFELINWHTRNWLPLLGYLGYIPFALELFALYQFIIGITGKNHLNDYVVFNNL